MKRVVVAFDLGGVVVDVDTSVIARFGDGAQAAFFGDGRHDAVTVGALDGDADLDAVGAALGGARRDDVEAAWRDVVRFSAGGLELVADVARRADVAVDVAIWSNTDPIHWRVLGGPLEALAASVAPSFQLGQHKPDAGYFEAALARAGVNASDVIFVDDRADNVAAARAAGIEAYAVEGVAAARAAIDAALARRRR